MNAPEALNAPVLSVLLEYGRQTPTSARAALIRDRRIDERVRVVDVAKALSDLVARGDARFDLGWGAYEAAGA